MSGPPFAMSKYASEADLLRDKCEWMTGLLRQIVAGWRQSGTAEVWAASALQIASEYVDGTRHQSGHHSDKVGRLVMNLTPSDETTEPAKFRTPLCCPVRTTCERERECSGMCAVRCRPGNEFQVGRDAFVARSLETSLPQAAEELVRQPSMTTFEIRSRLAPATGECRQQIEKLLAHCAELESQSVACNQQEKTHEAT